jgi:hypothetical protein
MMDSCEPTTLSAFIVFVAWLGGIIRSLFPWPAIVLILLLYPPLRGGFDRVVISLADSLRTLRRLKAAGVELTLDPDAAR